MRQLNTSLTRKKLSGAGLKKIALISMFLDHFAKIPYVYYLQQNGVANYTADLWYILMTSIGRLAFPLFAFLIAEGIAHTHNIRKYLCRMIFTAVSSQIPYSLAFNGAVWSFRQMNVFFTFSTAIVFTWFLKKVELHFQEKSKAKRYFAVCAVISIIFVLSELLNLEYGVFGTGLVLIFYCFRRNREKMLAILCLVGAPLFLLHCLAAGPVDQAAIRCIRELPATLSMPLIWMYNGERGKQSKNFYYFFYPLHLMFLLNLCLT